MFFLHLTCKMSEMTNTVYNYLQKKAFLPKAWPRGLKVIILFIRIPFGKSNAE